MKDEIMKHKYSLVFGIGIIAVLAIAIFSTPNTNGVDQTDTCSQYQFLNETSGECQPILKYGIPIYMFKDLPETPDDFGQIRTYFETGLLPLTACELGEEYWKQPMWYRHSFGRAVKHIPTKPMSGDFTHGYGIYPAEGVIVAEPGDKIRTCTTFRNSWQNLYWKFFNLKVGYPAKVSLSRTDFPDMTRNVEQNPEEVRKYFNVRVEPQNFFLGFTYGFFNNNWTEKLDIYIEVSPDTPKGKYAITIAPVAMVTEEMQLELEGWRLAGQYPIVEGQYSAGPFKLGISIV